MNVNEFLQNVDLGDLAATLIAREIASQCDEPESYIVNEVRDRMLVFRKPRTWLQQYEISVSRGYVDVGRFFDKPVAVTLTMTHWYLLYRYEGHYALCDESLFIGEFQTVAAAMNEIGEPITVGYLTDKGDMEWHVTLLTRSKPTLLSSPMMVLAIGNFGNSPAKTIVDMGYSIENFGTEYEYLVRGDNVYMATWFKNGEIRSAFADIRHNGVGVFHYCGTLAEYRED